MELEQTQEEFMVRYYRWALHDAQREVQEGFPFLRAIQDELVFNLLAFMDTLLEEDQVRYLLARVKLRHQKAVEVTGEYLRGEEETRYKTLEQQYQSLVTRPHTPDEQTIVDFMHQSGLSKGWASTIGVISPKALEIEEQLSSGAKHWVKRNVLAARIRDELRAVFQTPPKKQPGNVLKYTTPLEAWGEVQTEIDLGGNFHQLGYWHRLSPSPVNEENHMLSLSSWLGIDSVTKWTYLTEDDLTSAAKTVAKLCSHFMNAVPGLVAGLKVA